MKRLVLLAAMIGYLPVAKAEGKSEFSHNAEYRVRYQFDQAIAGDKDNDQNLNTVVHRFKLDTAFRASEKFAAQLSLLHNATWGDFAAGTVAENNDAGTSTPSGIATDENMVLVNQAYGSWMINDSLTLKFGRGGFTMADGSVVSQNDWQATPYAFDGVLLNYDKENFRLNVFGVKAIDQARGVGGFTVDELDNDDAEANFVGFALDWKSLPEFLKMANIHVLQVNKDELDVTADPTGRIEPSRDELRYGVALGGDLANIGLDYKLNYAAHTGETAVGGTKTDVEGSMIHAELGYSFPEFMKSRVHVAYHTDTGNDSGADDTSYDTFFYERHGASGLMDVVAWGNLTFIKAGWTFSPMDQLDVGIHYWMFERSENSDAVTANNNGSIVSGLTGGENNEDAIGSEVNLVATKKYDGGMSITTWAGMFMPGDYLKGTGVDREDTYTQFFVEGKMTF